MNFGIETQQAFTWIIGLLRKRKIPFQISGGFAANIYGSSRPLADIDIEIPDEKVYEIEQDVKKFIIYGPQRYVDNEFDLLLMSVNYKGQEIDLCGIDSLKLFDKKNKKWNKQKTDLSKATKKKIFNFIVPIIPLTKLINYKKKISRDVDIIDIEALE